LKELFFFPSIYQILLPVFSKAEREEETGRNSDQEAMVWRKYKVL